VLWRETYERGALVGSRTADDSERAILLVGMMGAGKSSVGRLLAERLGWSFIDSDARIEAAAGRSIPEIFARDGEAGFRKLETDALRQLPRTRAVIALGGGAPVSEANRRILAEIGRSIWLEASVETLVQRTAADANRPLLADLDAGERARRLRALEAERRSAYAHSKWRIDTDGCTTEQVVDTIRGWLASEGAP